jgi:hypothetical protein
LLYCALKNNTHHPLKTLKRKDWYQYDKAQYNHSSFSFDAHPTGIRRSNDNNTLSNTASCWRWDLHNSDDDRRDLANRTKNLFCANRTKFTA